MAADTAGVAVRTETGHGGRRRWLVTMAAVAALLAAAVPLIATRTMSGRQAMDHLNFHEPTIRIFAHDWPDFDLVGYLSATTPLYHLMMAAVCRFVHDSTAVLQYVGLGISAALIGLLAWACTARGRPALALTATLAAFSSHYLFFPAVWLLPDNLGWLGVLGILLLCLRGRVDWATYVVGGGLLALLVLARQVHIWAAAMIWVAAWMGPEHERGEGRAFMSRLGIQPAGGMAEGAWRAARAGAATIPAFLVLAFFVRLWGGLTPPLFQELNQAAPPGTSGLALRYLNPATPAFVLALLGLHGVFFAGSVGEPLLDLWRRRRWVVVGVAAAGLLAAVLPATTYAPEAGRSLGLWSLTRRAPVVMGHTSVLVAGLAVVGALTLAALCSRVPRREMVVLLVALLAFTASQAASKHLWQRYNAPMVLMVLALLACRAEATPAGTPGGWMGRLVSWGRRIEPIGPAVLTVLLGAMTLRMAWFDPPQVRHDAKWLMEGLFQSGDIPPPPRMEPEEPRREPAIRRPAEHPTGSLPSHAPGAGAAAG